MAKKVQKVSITEIISLRNLSSKAGIAYHKVYHNLVGTFKSLTHQEKTQLANALYDGISPFLKELGFYITIHRIKDPVLPEQARQEN